MKASVNDKKVPHPLRSWDLSCLIIYWVTLVIVRQGVCLLWHKHSDIVICGTLLARYVQFFCSLLRFHKPGVQAH